LGTTELGHTEEDPLAVRFTGEIITKDDTDGDVMGMVFGYRSAVDFFVVASSGEDPDGGTRNYGSHPSTHWYVARVHMTCGAACTRGTDTSDAIWNPAGHPTEITVLQEGTAYWKPDTRYTFAIEFFPANLQLEVEVINDEAEIVLTTGGFISAAVTGVADSNVVPVANVDAESRKGGYIGLYVDSQKDTHWEALECQGLPACDSLSNGILINGWRDTVVGMSADDIRNTVIVELQKTNPGTDLQGFSDEELLKLMCVVE
jgi:hypothetical protein